MLEGTEKKKLSVGVVREAYDEELTPGFGDTVGFHTDLRIFDNIKQSFHGGHRATGMIRSVVN